MVDMQNIINPDKRDFEPSLYILHINTNGLSLKDTRRNIYKQAIAPAEKLKEVF